ncbi:MAG: class I SAM-dependent methyltransferase [Deltaproteobacteria bacterium]|nr:class I SAM-dependent methyltransferase [Deltaproteobacteria bacterium]
MIASAVMAPGLRPAGTYGDKYTTRNPVARFLVNGFLDAVAELARRTCARRVLELGAGEGEVTCRVIEALRPELCVATDLAASCVRCAGGRLPEAFGAQVDAAVLPFRDEAFDLVVACEVLEHLEEPGRALREMRRVSGAWILASVPREPLWRALNVARLRYLADLGNTPGHRQHWSRSDFLDLVRTAGRIEEVRGPVPWTIALCRKS